MRRSCKDPGCIQTPCVKTLNTCVIEGAWLEALVLGVSGGGLVVGGGNGGGCCHPLGGKGGGFGPVTTVAVEPAAWEQPSLLGGVAGGFISVL